MMAPTLTEVVLRLTAALLCGAVLGWEREARGKAAGFRTNMLIALGSAAITLLSLEVAARSSGPGQYDPIRLLQGVIGGIGFLGAGAIMRAGGSIHGMTTAATIWVVGAIGIACGIGSYGIALICVVYCFIVLTVLDMVARRWIPTPDVKEDPENQDPEESDDGKKNL